MNSRLCACFAAACAAFAASAAGIELSGVTVKQDISRLVTVEYTLATGPAIVTVDFLTNGVSIGEKNFSNVYGDVNVRVEAGGGTKKIFWHPDKSWPRRRLAGGVLSARVTAWPVDDPPDYLCVALCETNIPTVRYFVSTNALPDGGLENREYKRSLLVMRRIHAAGKTWVMGAVDSDFDGATVDVNNNYVKPYETAHYVTLSEDYWLGIYLLTQEQVKQFTGLAYGGTAFSSSREDADICPRDNMQFRYMRGNNTDNTHTLGTGTCHLKTLRNATNVDFDLPYEAQWEFAARGGMDTLLWSGKPYSNDNLLEIEWAYSNTSTVNDPYKVTEKNPNGTVRYSHPVGLKPPNPYGLYDMLGNMYEFCIDFYQEDLGTAAVVDPKGPATGSNRVTRGTNHQRSYTPYGRASFRQYGAPNSASDMSGFRLMAPLTLKFPASE